MLCLKCDHPIRSAVDLSGEELRIRDAGSVGGKLSGPLDRKSQRSIRTVDLNDRVEGGQNWRPTSARPHFGTSDRFAKGTERDCALARKVRNADTFGLPETDSQECVNLRLQGAGGDHTAAAATTAVARMALVARISAKRQRRLIGLEARSRRLAPSARDGAPHPPRSCDGDSRCRRPSC